MQSDVDRQLDEIFSWDRARCLEAWVVLTGTEPGSRLSTSLLKKALIFEAQCKALGGHSPAVQRLLKAPVTKGQPATHRVPPGTQLVREWNGRVYRVNVTPDGFEMDGQSYSSLSAVAKRITGAGWSGPRFFGLKAHAS